jgi:hypothetical protein
MAGGGFEAALAVQEGALVCTNCGAEPWVFGALDVVTFRPREREGERLVFRVEEGKVKGLTWREGRQETSYERIEGETRP